VTASEVLPQAVPARARRMDVRPLPRLRPLTEVLAELVPAPRPVEAVPPDADTTVGGPAWDAALETAAAQVRPLAVAVLTALAEVLDGRRPVGHLARLCPEALVERVRAAAPRAAAGFPTGARVRGLRVCPVVGLPGADGAATMAVEVAAALCGRAPDHGRSRRTGGALRARAAAARFELDGTGTWRVTELAVV
jgi:hypothetical protein